jgi:hypothetical protein
MFLFVSFWTLTEFKSLFVLRLIFSDFYTYFEWDISFWVWEGKNGKGNKGFKRLLFMIAGAGSVKIFWLLWLNE